MKIASLISLLFLALISCSTPKTTQPKVLVARTTLYETITIASFNITSFGLAKADKPEEMALLAETIAGFDIVAIQAIRDTSGTAIEMLEDVVDALGEDYRYIFGTRPGRTRSNEQYAYFYRSETIQHIDHYTYDDLTDMFHREPFIAYFRTKTGHLDFVLINIHTDPDEAAEEMRALPEVMLDAQQQYDEPDIILLGDLNADCPYFDESTYESIFPPHDYNWLISNDEDTTVRDTACTYDRIVTTVSTNQDFTGLSGVYRFDIIQGLSQEDAVGVSDHYPVWAEFRVDKDSD